MIKYGTKLYRCEKCGWQMTLSDGDLEKVATMSPCSHGYAKHTLIELTKEDDDGVQEVQEIQSGR